MLMPPTNAHTCTHIHTLQIKCSEAAHGTHATPQDTSGTSAWHGMVLTRLLFIHKWQEIRTLLLSLGVLFVCVSVCVCVCA